MKKRKSENTGDTKCRSRTTRNGSRTTRNRPRKDKRYLWFPVGPDSLTTNLHG
ncbi:hypothetical protein T03_12687 [Trichinella britovi]|uniref:Uncharacterized protein n=1 Tax=Trichinella britovi TaxID=45882 RepID=A0A0V1AI28_TRIBR|nr:hypothetical protein T03_12687 [Trichinella britovi]